MRWRRFRTFVLCVASLGFLPSAADALITVGSIDTPKTLLDVAVADGLAYVVSGVAPIGGPPRGASYPDSASSLRVIDVSNPESPVEISAIDTLEGAAGVAVVDGLAYLANGSAGLRIIDVSNPSSLVEIGAFGPYDEGAGYAKDVAVEAGTAYLVNGTTGLLLIDVSDPTSPAEIGAIDTPGDARDIAVSGGYAYVADGNWGLRVIDVSQPDALVEVASLEVPGRADEVAIAEGFAYVVGVSSGLRVIDIADPTAPFEVSAVESFPHPHSVAVDGKLAYILAGAVLAAGELHPGGLMAIDVSNPAIPVELGSLLAGGYALAVVDRYAYAAGGWRSGGYLSVIDVSHPEAPVGVGATSRPGLRDVDVANQMAYVASGSDLEVIDVSDPATPSLIGGVSTGSTARGLVVLDGMAYVAASDAGLRVIDVSNPEAPVEIGALDSLGTARDVAVAGQFAYVASSEDDHDCGSRCPPGFSELLDGGFSEDNTVRYTDGLGSGESTGSANYNDLDPAPAWGVPVDGESTGPINYLDTGRYLDLDPTPARGVPADGESSEISENTSGLRVIDISNPEAPVEVGSVDTPGGARQVAVAGGFAYVADGPAGLRVIDISNPEAPVEVGSFAAEAPAEPRLPIARRSVESVAVAGGFAYLSGSGFRVIDVSVPEVPVQVGALDRGLLPCGGAIIVANGLVYGGCNLFSMSVIDVSTPESPFTAGALLVPTSSVAVANGLTYIVGDYHSIPQYSGLSIFNLGAEYAAGIEVELDIRPERRVKVINLRSRGVVLVAVRGTDSFDVEDVDATALAFGPGGAAPAHKKCGHVEDINADGFMDLLLHYRVQELGIAPGDTEVCVKGKTLSGTDLDGCIGIQTSH